MAELYRDPYARLEALARGEDPDAAAPPSYPSIVTDRVALDRAGRVAQNEGRSESGRALRKGIEGIKSAGESVLGLARIGLGDEDGGLANLRGAQARSEEAAEFGPRVQQFDQVESAGDFGEYVRNVALEQIPNIALTVGTGGAGGAARVAAGAAAKKASTSILGRAAGEAVAKRAAFDQGAKVGAAAGGAVLQSSIAPDIVLDPDAEGTVRERAGVAAIGAIATGALESMPVGALFRRYGLTGASEAVTGGVLARMAKQGIGQGASEATTEVAQTFGEKLAHKWVNDNVEVIGPEAYGDYINALAGGFVGGSVFGAPAGLRGSGKEGAAYMKAKVAMERIVDDLEIQPDGSVKPKGPTPGPDVAAPEGTATPNVDPDAPLKTGPLGSINVAGMAEGIKESLEGVSSKFQDFFSKENRSSSVKEALEGMFADGLDNDFDSMLSGENGGAYGYKIDDSGIVDLNNGAGVPYARFSDTSRARQYKDAGADTYTAAIMATVPEQHVARLLSEGVFDSVRQSIQGDYDAADKAQLSAYVSVLEPEARKQYLRTVMTARELSAKDAQFASFEPGQANLDENGNPATPNAGDSSELTFDEQETTKEQEVLRKPTDTKRMLRGTRILKPGAAIPKDAYVSTDAKGKRRAGSSTQLGYAISQIQQDPDFRDNTRTMSTTDRQVAAVVTLMADMKEGGMELDPKSLVPGLKLGKDWAMTEAVSKKVQTALADQRRTDGRTKRADGTPAFALQQQTNNEPAKATVGDRNKQQQGELNREFGRSDFEQTQTDDTDRITDAGRVQGPRSGVPRLSPEVRVIGEDRAKVSEAQAIDSKDDVDQDAAREEREQYAPDAFNKLDKTLERMTGEKVDGDFAYREKLYQDVLKNGRDGAVPSKPGVKARKRTPLGRQERAELIREYRDFLEASLAAGEKNVERRQAEWGKNKNPATAKKLENAQTAVEITGEKLAEFETRDEQARRKAANNAEKPKKRAKVVARTEGPREQSYVEGEKEAPAKRVAKKAEPGVSAPNEIVEGSDAKTAARAAAVLRAKTQAKKLTTKQLKEKLGLAELASNSSPVTADQFTAAGIDSAIPKTRSIQELYQIGNRLSHTVGISEAKRADLQQKVVDAIDTMRAALESSNKKEGIGRRPGTKDMVFSDPHVKRVARALEGVTTLEEGLRAALSHATKAQQNVINTLLRMGAVKGVPLKVDRDASAGLTHGGYWSNTADGGLGLRMGVTLSIGEAIQGRSNLDPVHTLVHEAIHAATVSGELMTPRLRGDLKALLDHVRAEMVKRNIDPDSWYGLTETQEFLAEAFTNPQLQDILRGIPALNTKSFANMWEQVKDFLGKMLGMTDPESASALDEVLTIGLQMARVTADHREGHMRAAMGVSAADLAYGESGSFSARSMDTGSLVATPMSGGKPNDYMTMLPPRERIYLLNAFSREDVLAQIRAALPPNRRNELASADKGPELLINTGIALALQNQLDIEAGAKGAIRQLYEVIRQILGVPSSLAYGRQIMADIRSQKVREGYSAQAQLLGPTMLAATRFIETKVTPAARAFLSDMDTRMRATGVPALTELATLFSQRTGEFRSDGQNSFSRRVMDERGKRLNEYFEITKDWDDAKKAAVARALQKSQTDEFVVRRTVPPGATDYVDEFESLDADAKKVLAFLKDMRKYLGDSGLKMGTIESYFPVTIDGEAIAKNKDAFIALMNAPEFKDDVAKAGGAEALYRQAVASTNTEQQLGTVTFADGQHDPTFKPLNKRLSAFVYKKGTPAQIAAFAEFQDTKLDRIMVQYTNRAVRRAEWSSLGLGERTKEMLAKAKEQGASEKDLNLANDYVAQIMGSYARDWHPGLKRVMDVVGLGDLDFNKFQRLQTALITYQNLRLLPLALVSSFIDPLGSMIRNGGSVKQSFKSYREGLRAFRDKEGNDALRAMAEDMGIIERHAVSEALIYMYGGGTDPTGTSAKINATLFKWNGLEAMTKYSRLAALANGQRFLLKHAGEGNAHSARYLQELGLTKDDIKIAPALQGYRGPPVLMRNPKVDAALTRFVDESVVRPTPAQRPGWHNDPHFALAAQYKGYLYSFWNTVVRRAVLEAKNGNYAVAGPVLMYLPVTMVGEMMRDMAQGDDEDREMTDYAWLSVERSGLLGPRVDVMRNARQDMSYGNSALNSVAGPTGQQLGQMYDALNGQRRIGGVLHDALPLSALHEDWFDAKKPSVQADGPKLSPKEMALAASKS